MTDTDAAERSERIAAQLAKLIAAFRETMGSRGGRGYCAQLCGWSSVHERPGHTERLHAGLDGRDPPAEPAARIKTFRIQ
jgi:hypothetical protein